MQEPGSENNKPSEDNEGATQGFSEIVIGGSIEKSKQGLMNVSVMDMIKEAFSACRPARLQLGLALLVTLGAMMLLLQVSSPLNSLIPQPILLTLMQIIVTPLITGLSMMGIHCALGGKLQVKQVFDPVKRAAPLIQASVLILGLSLIVSSVLSVVISDVLLQMLLTGIVQLLLGFVYPLIVEKRMDPVTAISISFQVSWRYIHKIIACNLVTVLLVTIGFLPALSALAEEGPSPLAYVASFLFFIFIAAPFYFVINGILYRELFGIKVLVSNKTQLSGMFDA